MTAQTWNKITTAVGSDAWNPVLHMKGLADTAHVVIPVASQAERDALAGFAPGGVLPVPTLACRTDVVGKPVEKWDGSTWVSMSEESVPWVGLGVWTTPNGTLSRRWNGAKWIVTFIGHLVLSTNAPFTLTTAMATIGTAAPAGWRPAPGTAYGTGAYSNNTPTYQGPIVARIDTDGVLSVAAVTGTLSVVENCQFFIDISWTY